MDNIAEGTDHQRVIFKQAEGNSRYPEWDVLRTRLLWKQSLPKEKSQINN